MGSTDDDWIDLGKTNPYYGVISHPRYLKGNLSDHDLEEFFSSGENHIGNVYRTICNIQPEFKPIRVLDFGCGVGRLVIPFAQIFSEVVGLDISPKMLEEAQQNCIKYGATNVRLLQVSEISSLEECSFDLVHSYIVLQHVPVKRGELILRQLITFIRDGGVGAIHFTFSDTRPVLHRIASALIHNVGVLRALRNKIKHLPAAIPRMQMNHYSLNRIFDILSEAHCSNLHIEFSQHDSTRGVMIYFEKLYRAPL